MADVSLHPKVVELASKLDLSRQIFHPIRLFLIATPATFSDIYFAFFYRKIFADIF
jgi:hypothetical protein